MSHPPRKSNPSRPATRAEEFRPDTLRLDQILDSEPEPAFDDIARLAARDTECSAAVISLVAPGGHWLKSRIGLSAAEFFGALIFSEHLVSQDETLVVEDVQTDRAFARVRRDRALSPGQFPFRFLAGIPLRAKKGKPLGTLCVLDRSPRKLRARHVTALQTLARQVLTQVEVRRIMAELSLAVGEARRAELWRAAIESWRPEHRGQPLGAVTLSFGVAACPAHASAAADLLRAADLALYQAKSEGRDRVCVASSPAQTSASASG